jgi:HSP20 family protein
MTTLVRWDPFSDFRKTVRMFDESFTRPRRFVATSPTSSVPVEVSETDADFEIKAALPGVDPEKVEISVHDDVLTIRGSHEEQSEDKQREFYRREFRYGSFSRSLALPTPVDSDKAEASFTNGVLNLRLPKAEANKPKLIKVTAGATTETPAVEGSTETPATETQG